MYVKKATKKKKVSSSRLVLKLSLFFLRFCKDPKVHDLK